MFIDLFPTIVDFTNSTLSEKHLPIDGMSLRSLLENKENDLERDFYNATHETDWDGKKHHWDTLKDKNDIHYENQKQRISVRNQRYKLVGGKGDYLYEP